MSKEKLLEFVEVGDHQARKMNYPFYWETPDGKRLGNVYVARWYEKEFNCWLSFVTAPELVKEFRETLKDKSLDMNYNYSVDFIKRLKQEYKHVALLYSGGYDSHAIMMDFIKNNIHLDEIVVHFFTETDDNMNEEYRENAFPSLYKYCDQIGKQTFLYQHEDELLEHFSDEFAFFKRPQCGTIIEPMSSLQIENFYNGATPYDYGVPKNIDKKLDMDPHGCFIIGKDKPQLVYYKNRWYVTFLSSVMNDRGGLLNTIYFWGHPGNVKTLIQQSRMYRSFILDYKYGIEKKDQYNKLDTNSKDFDDLGTLAFFKFYEQDEQNYVIDRPDIANADKKLGKNAKFPMEKGNFLVQDRWDIVFNYAGCMKKFLEIFPECNKGFEDFANQGKFAWFIEIDSLEFYTQQELIPNGFEDIKTVKYQGLAADANVLGNSTTQHKKPIDKSNNRHIREIRKLSDQDLAKKMLNKIKEDQNG
jgi:hypothetical protein